MAPLLQLSGVSKRYGGVQANAGIDLSVDAGSIHAILGENGAGKSTLMKLIYGVERPDEGQVLWQGQAVTLSSPSDARRLGIGMVFQHFSLFETLSVVQNMALIVPGSDLVIENVGMNVTRTGLITVLEQMGGLLIVTDMTLPYGKVLHDYLA